MYSENLFPEIDWYKKTEIDHKYMVTTFIPNLIKIFEEGIKSEEPKDRGASFLIGINNKLFQIQEDYSVLCPSLGFQSVGSGGEYAMGSMITTKDMNINTTDRIILALKSAEIGTPYVQRPFRLINTVEEKEDCVIS